MALKNKLQLLDILSIMSIIWLCLAIVDIIANINYANINFGDIFWVITLFTAGSIFWIIGLVEMYRKGDWIWFILTIIVGMLFALIYYFYKIRPKLKKKEERKRKKNKTKRQG
jgi:O-antigen/teichoic acid export membrane protein